MQRKVLSTHCIIPPDPPTPTCSRTDPFSCVAQVLFDVFILLAAGEWGSDRHVHAPAPCHIAAPSPLRPPRSSPLVQVTVPPPQRRGVRRRQGRHRRVRCAPPPDHLPSRPVLQPPTRSPQPTHAPAAPLLITQPPPHPNPPTPPHPITQSPPHHPSHPLPPLPPPLPPSPVPFPVIHPIHPMPRVGTPRTALSPPQPP